MNGVGYITMEGYRKSLHEKKFFHFTVFDFRLIVLMNPKSSSVYCFR